MKKVIIYAVAAVALLACASCANKKNVITGHFDGLPCDSLKVEVVDILNARVPLSTTIIPATNGDFTIPFADTTVRGIIIYCPDDERGREHGVASITFVPGEYAKLSGRLDSVVVDGSQFFKDQKAYAELVKPDQDRMSEIVQEYRAAADDEAKSDSIMNVYNEVNAHVNSLTKDFIKNNPASLYGATLVSRLIGEDGKDALEVLDIIPETVQNGYLKPLIDRSRTGAQKTKARAEAAEKVKDGMQAPDFTLKNEKGEDFTLSSIYNNGQYIILDFWGEWCYWCKKGIPDMKQLYKDAKGKIEILSIDCNDTEEVWKNAIKEHELPWLHVYNPGDEKTDVAVTYAIKGYPTKLILNPDGTINKTIIGEDPEFYTYVKSLIGKK
jgi:thiol-disulfide isomerase/thioredoxin